MKKIFTLLLLAAAFTACSDDKDSMSDRNSKVISFETADGLKFKNGLAVTLGQVDMTVNGIASKYTDVFCAKSLAEEGVYDGYLCYTPNEAVRFGASYSNAYGDFWSGFSLSANYSRTSVENGDYSKQFSAWVPKGANGTATCMIGYDGSYSDGPVYSLPTIEFAEQHAVKHLYLANTTTTYSYEPQNVDAKEYYYRIVIVGSVGGVETGRATFYLVKDGKRVADWTCVDLKSLGKVSKLTFKPESNDTNNYGSIAPAYFALDDLCVYDL